MTAKAVLITLAIHANESGYTWPGVERIASAWGMDRETVRRQVEALLVRRKIYRTKQRRGATGQVKVYRLPKITYESGGKARDKRGISGGKSTPNNEHNEQGTKNNDEFKTLGNSIPAALSSVLHPSGFVFGAHQHLNQSARDHPKWQEFAAYCASQKGKPAKDGRIHDGTPREDGFRKWLLRQDPYWRDKVKPRDHIDGFVLGHTFYPTDEANRMAEENPELALKSRRATKRGVNVHVIDSPSGFTGKSGQYKPDP